MATHHESLILIDSSVWIDYYRPRGPERLKRQVQEALEENRVATIGLIAVEVLQGAPNVSSFAALREDFLGFQWLELTQDLWLEAARLGNTLRHSGVSIPTTDIVIAATALHYKARLWHRDNDFTRLAHHTPSLHASTLS